MPLITTGLRNINSYIVVDNNFRILNIIRDVKEVETSNAYFTIDNETEVTQFMIPTTNQYEQQIVSTIVTLARICENGTTLFHDQQLLLRNHTGLMESKLLVLRHYICHELIRGKGEMKGDYYISEGGNWMIECSSNAPLVVDDLSEELNVYL